jgi:hypothetical protein
LAARLAQLARQTFSTRVHLVRQGNGGFHTESITGTALNQQALARSIGSADTDGPGFYSPSRFRHVVRFDDS